MIRHTLFADQRVVAVVGVVGITRRSRPAITQGAEIELLNMISESRGFAHRQERYLETHVRIYRSGLSCDDVSDGAEK